MQPCISPPPKIPPASEDSPPQLRKRISQVFTKMIVRAESPPSLPPQVPLPSIPPEPASRIPNFSRPSYDAGCKKEDEPVAQEVRPRNRLTKGASKHFSAPASPNPFERAASENEVTTARQSIANIPQRSFSTPLRALEIRPTSSSRTPSNDSTASSATSSSKSSTQSSRVSSVSTAPSLYTRPISFYPQPPLLAPSQNYSPPATSRKFNPLEHYIPCLHPSCTTHYISASLGPTYLSAQQPYGLHRKRGLCPVHASKDLKAANVDCKKIYERMRQSAGGRKTLGDIAREFDLYVKMLDSERQAEGHELAKQQEKLVTGISGDEQKARKKKLDEDLGWRYLLRPCTRQSCPFAPYSPFSIHNFTFYSTPHRSGLFLPLTTLCPACARRDVEGMEAVMKEKREEMDDEEWVGWLEGIRMDRRVEEEFWEKAQERVVRESLARRLGGKKAVEKNEVVQGSGKIAGKENKKDKEKDNGRCIVM